MRKYMGTSITFLKRETAPLRLEPANERKRDQETEHAKNISSDLMRQLVFAGNEEHQQGAHERSEQDDAQDVMCKKVHSYRLSAHAAQQHLHMVPVIRQKNDEPEQNQHCVTGKKTGL